MLKELKLVINTTIIVFIIVFNTCHSQNQEYDNDTYLLINEVIKKTSKSTEKDKVYNLGKKSYGAKGLIKKYYELRFNNRPFYKTFAVDSITGEPYIDTLTAKQNIIKWKAKLSLLDQIFTQQDLEKIIESENRIFNWDLTKISFSKEKELSIELCNSRVYCNNFISKPYFNIKKNYGILFHSVKRKKTTMYLFKKEK